MVGFLWDFYYSHFFLCQYRWASRIMQWAPENGRRSRGRPKKRCVLGRLVKSSGWLQYLEKDQGDLCLGVEQNRMTKKKYKSYVFVIVGKKAFDGREREKWSSIEIKLRHTLHECINASLLPSTHTKRLYNLCISLSYNVFILAETTKWNNLLIWKRLRKRI